MEIKFTKIFKEKYEKLRDPILQKQVDKHIIKILQNPDIGKPMREERKGTREVHINSFRLAYSYHESIIFIIDIYHKDDQ